MDLTPSQDESTSQAQPQDPLTHKDTQELLKTPSQDSMEVDDGLAQKMLAALEESEGKFQNALNFWAEILLSFSTISVKTTNRIRKMES